MKALGLPIAKGKTEGQTAGKGFEDLIKDFLEEVFDYMQGILTGEMEIFRTRRNLGIYTVQASCRTYRDSQDRRRENRTHGFEYRSRRLSGYA